MDAEFVKEFELLKQRINVLEIDNRTHHIEMVKLREENDTFHHDITLLQDTLNSLYIKLLNAGFPVSQFIDIPNDFQTYAPVHQALFQRLARIEDVLDCLIREFSNSAVSVARKFGGILSRIHVQRRTCYGYPYGGRMGGEGDGGGGGEGQQRQQREEESLGWIRNDRRGDRRGMQREEDGREEHIKTPTHESNCHQHYQTSNLKVKQNYLVDEVKGHAVGTRSQGIDVNDQNTDKEDAGITNRDLQRSASETSLKQIDDKNYRNNIRDETDGLCKIRSASETSLKRIYGEHCQSNDNEARKRLDKKISTSETSLKKHDVETFDCENKKGNERLSRQRSGSQICLNKGDDEHSQKNITKDNGGTCWQTISMFEKGNKKVIKDISIGKSLQRFGVLKRSLSDASDIDSTTIIEKYRSNNAKAPPKTKRKTSYDNSENIVFTNNLNNMSRGEELSLHNMIHVNSAENRMGGAETLKKKYELSNPSTYSSGAIQATEDLRMNTIYKQRIGNKDKNKVNNLINENEGHDIFVRKDQHDEELCACVHSEMCFRNSEYQKYDMMNALLDNFEKNEKDLLNEKFDFEMAEEGDVDRKLEEDIGCFPFSFSSIFRPTKSYQPELSEIMDANTFEIKRIKKMDKLMDPRIVPLPTIKTPNTFFQDSHVFEKERTERKSTSGLQDQRSLATHERYTWRSQSEDGSSREIEIFSVYLVHSLQLKTKKHVRLEGFHGKQRTQHIDMTTGIYTTPTKGSYNFRVAMKQGGHGACEWYLCCGNVNDSGNRSEDRKEERTTATGAGVETGRGSQVYRELLGITKDGEEMKDGHLVHNSFYEGEQVWIEVVRLEGDAILLYGTKFTGKRKK